MKTEEKIAVMQAYTAGKPIEASTDGSWDEVINPVWNWETTTYRVKQEPTKLYAFKSDLGNIIYRIDDCCPINYTRVPQFDLTFKE
jgi:hypothetical protein